MTFRTWLVLGVGSLVATAFGGQVVGRLVGAVARELARAAF
jgi:hypothetical protein